MVFFDCLLGRFFGGSEVALVFRFDIFDKLQTYGIIKLLIKYVTEISKDRSTSNFIEC